MTSLQAYSDDEIRARLATELQLGLFKVVGV